MINKFSKLTNKHPNMERKSSCKRLRIREINSQNTLIPLWRVMSKKPNIKRDLAVLRSHTIHWIEALRIKKSITKRQKTIIIEKIAKEKAMRSGSMRTSTSLQWKTKTKTNKYLPSQYYFPACLCTSPQTLYLPQSQSQSSKCQLITIISKTKAHNC